jgi:hypothetical protein
MSPIVSDVPEIDAFHREGLRFETSGDLGVALTRIARAAARRMGSFSSS